MHFDAFVFDEIYFYKAHGESGGLVKKCEIVYQKIPSSFFKPKEGSWYYKYDGNVF